MDSEHYEFLLSFSQPIIDRIADIERSIIELKEELKETQLSLELVQKNE